MVVLAAVKTMMVMLSFQWWFYPRTQNHGGYVEFSMVVLPKNSKPWWLCWVFNGGFTQELKTMVVMLSFQWWFYPRKP